MLAKVTLVHSYSGVICENTYGLNMTDGTDMQATAEAIATNLAASAWMSGRSDQMSLIEVRCEDVVPGTGTTGSAILAPPLTGDDAGNGTPPLVTINVKWRGTLKGKAGRGRMFLSGFPASTAIGGFWTSDAQDPASAAASVIFDLHGPSGTGDLCIINRQAGGVAIDPPTSNPIVGFSIDNVVRRQGRREQGRGI